jgi:hypothetical protein
MQCPKDHIEHMMLGLKTYDAWLDCGVKAARDGNTLVKK